MRNSLHYKDLCPGAVSAEPGALLLRNAILADLLEWMPREKAAAELEANGIRLDLNRPLLLAASRIDQFPPENNSHQRFQVLLRVEEVFRRFLCGAFRGEHISFENKDMVWILQSDDPGDRTLVFCREALETIQRHTREQLGLSLSIVYDEFIPFEDLRDHYRQIMLVLHQICVQGDREVLTGARFYRNRNGLPPAEGLPASRTKLLAALHSALDQCDVEKFLQTVDRIIDSSRHGGMAHNLEMYHVLCGAMLDYMAERGAAEGILSDPELFAFFCSYGDGALLRDSLRRLAEDLARMNRITEMRRGEMLIHSVNNYIRANLGGDLSLSSMADTFYLHPGYLSRVYKQQTGENLSDTISRRRIGLAREMLAHSSLRINEIARECGYDSTAYFIRLFKKSESMTPREWRKKNRAPLIREKEVDKVL